MIFIVNCDEASYLTLVVRAASEDEARVIGAKAAGEYLDHVPHVELERVDPSGPAGVIVEDPS